MPINSTRDQLVASFYERRYNQVTPFYIVPSWADLHMQKINTTLVMPEDGISFVQVLMRPPGEADAVYHLGGVGFSSQDWHADPLICPPGTVFSVYINVANPAKVTYQFAQVMGLLVATNVSLWT